MRKLIVCNMMSLDGYYTGPGNNVMVLPIFEGKPAVSLRPIDMRKWDDSENILIRYEVRHKSV